MSEQISLSGRRIALIGGAGFIGHNLAFELRRRGAQVAVVDGLQVNNLLAYHSTESELQNRRIYLNLLEDRLELLRQHQIPLHVQDARDYLKLAQVLDELKPQVIVLLAAVAHASRSNKDPYSTFDHSLRTLENALDLSRGSEVEQFIYFSSSMVYGNFNGLEVTEDSPCKPMGIYGTLKLCGEQLVAAYNQVFGLPYTIIRPSALYGERCVSRRVGQIFIENALQGLDITIKGDGEDRLDFTYIQDLVHGLCCCMEHRAAINQTFNLTYGQGRSINEMAQILQSEFPEVKVRHVERDGLMPERGTLDVSKAKALIGYAPAYPLEKGYRSYIQWYREIAAHYGFRRAPSATSQVNE